MAEQFAGLDDDTRRAIGQAQEEAVRLNYNEVRPEHLLLGMVREDNAAVRLLSALGAGVIELRDVVERGLPRGERAVLGELPLTKPARAALNRCVRLAQERGQNEAGPQDLLLALLDECDSIRGLLSVSGINADGVRAGIRRVTVQHAEPWVPADRQPLPALIARFGREVLPDLRGRLPTLDAPRQAIERAAGVLTRARAGNPVLLAASGSTRMAAVRGLAHRIRERLVPQTLEGARVVAVNAIAMVRNLGPDESLQGCLDGLLQEVQSGGFVLFIDELQAFVNAANRDLTQAFSAALGRHEVRCVAAMTAEDYALHVEPNPRLRRIFVPVRLDPPR